MESKFNKNCLIFKTVAVKWRQLASLKILQPTSPWSNFKSVFLTVQTHGVRLFSLLLSASALSHRGISVWHFLFTFLFPPPSVDKKYKRFLFICAFGITYFRSWLKSPIDSFSGFNTPQTKPVFGRGVMDDCIMHILQNTTCCSIISMSKSRKIYR